MRNKRKRKMDNWSVGDFLGGGEPKKLPKIWKEYEWMQTQWSRERECPSLKESVHHWTCGLSIIKQPKDHQSHNYKWDESRCLM